MFSQLMMIFVVVFVVVLFDGYFFEGAIHARST